MKRPTMALFEEGNRHVARMIPKDDVITTSDIDGFRLVPVKWEGQQALMFAQDIRSNSEEIDENSSREIPTVRPRRKMGVRLRKGLSGKWTSQRRTSSKTP